MYKKILAPLDGSELSECSLEHVKAIVTGCRVPEVVLLRVVEPAPAQAYLEVSEDFRRGVEEKTLAEAGDYLSKAAANLKKEGAVAQTAVIGGRAAEEILDYASKNQVDLIVMSTHGRSGISRWVMGSVAEKIMRHSPIPVLMVSPSGCRR